MKLVSSVSNEGSIFVLYLPQYDFNELTVLHERNEKNSKPLVFKEIHTEPVDLINPRIIDDRSIIQAGDRVLLIVEDDQDFAKIILDLAREEGFKGIIAMRGSQVITLAQHYKPDAITLDIRMPDTDGWIILEKLKHDPELRHIPVEIITVDDDIHRGYSHGAFQFITKPVSRKKLSAALSSIHQLLDRPIKNLLLLATNKESQKQISDLLANNDLEIKTTHRAKTALSLINKHHFDCVVVELKLKDINGLNFIAKLQENKDFTQLPVVLYSNEPLSKEESTELEHIKQSGLVKTVSSPARLLDQTAVFLHRITANLPKEKQELIVQAQYDESFLKGKKVLIVDDDVRNIFALTAALERKGMYVCSVESGHAALDYLKDNPEVDMILMDIMMPDLDGYQTTLSIRKMAKFKKLPIIALTAKAMVGDREKCIKAGASDYLSKPINIDQLASIMQGWLS